MDYDTLVAAKSTDGSIKSWINHASAPSTQILTEAEAWIYQRLRAWQMRVESSWSAAAGADGITLPSDFVAPISLFIDGYGELPYKHEALFSRPRDDDGTLYTGTHPDQWTILGNAIVFDIELSEARAGDFWYYEFPDALSSSNTTNFLTDRYPTLLRYACMKFGFEWRKRKDDELLYEGKARAELDEANQMADYMRLGQSLS